MSLLSGILVGFFIGFLFKYTVDNFILKEYNAGKWLDYLIKNGYVKFRE